MYVYIIRKYDACSGAYEVGGVHSSYASAHDWLIDQEFQYDDMEKTYWRNGDECVIEKHEVVCYNACLNINDWI